MSATLQTTVQNDVAQKISCLWKLVGNTPMVAVRCTLDGVPHTVYAKLEYFNFTGSIKDRMALHVMQRGYETGTLQASDRICEATSGNTGIAFTAIGRALGHDTHIYMPNWLSRERVDVIRALGATIHLVSKEDGGFLGSIAMAEQFAAENGNVFLPCQFTNEHNIEAHELTTGVEIASQLASVGKTPDAFVAGVGTGGTVMGVARTLRRVNPDVRIHPLEPAESPTLTTGYKVGSHRIQGISDEFIPAIVDLSSLDPVISVSDGDAIMMAQKISASLGLAVGISSGANFIGALKALETLEPDATVATIFCDCNKKYLSTDLMKEQPVREGYYSPRVELLGVTVIPRLP